MYYFLHPYSSFHSHWYCLVSIFITSWLYYTVDSPVCSSLICLPSYPSVPLMSKRSSWSTCLIILLLCSKSSLVSVCLPDKVWATGPYILKVLGNLVPNLLLDFDLSFSFTSPNAWISCLHDIDPAFYLCSLPETPALNPHANLAPSLHWLKSYFPSRSTHIHCCNEAFSDFPFPHYLREAIFPSSELL